MKTFEEDKELEQLIKSIALERPAPDFTKNLMNRVFQERSVSEQVKAESILGKGFWIFVSLFALLIIAIFLFSGENFTSEPAALFSEMKTDKYISDYRSIFESLGNLPAGIAGIFLASSLLVFLERFLSARKPGLT